MNDTNSDSFLKELENDCPFSPLFSSINQPLIDEEEQAVLGSSFDVEDLLNLVSPLTAAVPPPIAVMSPPAQPCDLATTSNDHHESEASRRKKKAHTLSARKRRGRFSESLKVLQGLLPNCNKSDRTSIVDAASDYIRSLLQLQNKRTGMNPATGPGFPMLAYYPYQLPYMAQASNPIGPMWSAPGLYPYNQVQIPNMDQQFNGVHQDQNPNP